MEMQEIGSNPMVARTHEKKQSTLCQPAVTAVLIKDLTVARLPERTETCLPELAKHMLLCHTITPHQEV